MAALIVPWRPGCPHREAAWSHLKARHHQTHPGWDIIEGHAPDGPWCKAAAVVDGLTRTDADLIVIHDADVWTDGLDDAVAALDRDTQWAIPHGKVYRLAKDRHEPSTNRQDLTQPPYTGYAGGGIVALHRSAYEHCPIDVRYTGWGQEDASWALALTCLYGAPWRGDAPLWHWWHPAQERQTRVIGSRESANLHKRYKAASKDRSQMLDLIGEVPCRWRPPMTSKLA